MRIVPERQCRQYAPGNGFNLLEEGEGEDRKSVLIQSQPPSCCLYEDFFSFFFKSSDLDVAQPDQGGTTYSKKINKKI